MVRRLLFVVVLVTAARLVWAQGNPLGPEFRVNTFTYNVESEARVARSSVNFVVVWQSGAPQGANRVFGQRYDDAGTPLGPEFRLNTSTSPTEYHFQPAVAAAPSGNFVAVWGHVEQYGSYADVLGQRYDTSGTPIGTEFRVNSYTTGVAARPAVALDALGKFVVVWTGDDGSSVGIRGQRYAANGSPLGAEFVVNSYTAESQGTPSIAVDSLGNLVVCWASWSQDGDQSGVFAQRYAGGGTLLGPEFRVNTYTTGRQQFPAVAADSSGNFIVVWESQQDGSSYGIYAQRYASSGAPLGAEFRVNSLTTQRQYRPAVTADALGNFVVVWTTNPQSGVVDVDGQRYANSGMASGAEFRVITTGAGRRPAVAANLTGDFVVVWDGGLTPIIPDIYGQRYGRIVPVELMRFIVD